MTGGSVDELVRNGYDAYRRGDAATARSAFEQAALQRESGEVLEGIARALHLVADYLGATDAYERAYAAYRQEGDLLALARSARTLAWFRGWLYGDWAVCGGWMARARTLLEQADEDTNAHGWVVLDRARSGNDLETQRSLFLRAVEIARRHGDADLECEAMSRLGCMLALSGHVDEGLALMDEALVAVCAGDVEDLSVAEGIFCGLFYVCERTHEVARAEQWLRVADEVVRRRGFTAISGYCRIHYGGILTAAGRWTEAEAELTTAVRVFAPEHVRVHGSAVARLADLRLRQGRVEEAATLLHGIEQHDDAVRPYAALHLARGETALAQDLLERALAPDGLPDAVEGPLLALLAEVQVARGSLPDAEATAARLTALAGEQSGRYLKGLAALVSGRVCLATGRGDARGCLHEAMATFAEAELPVDVARVRLELARAVASERPEVAVAEATAALETFEQVHASRDADAAAALLRSLGAPGRTGPKGTGGLTRREGEVMELLGHGLTNAQIGDRLFISPKTVEHHVGRLLAKLGLRSRAQAAAYAVRTPAQRAGDE